MKVKKKSLNLDIKSKTLPRLDEKKAKKFVSKAETEIQKKEEPVKIIPDSFTMPESDYALIEKLKERLLKMGISLNKSEILRAGLKILYELPDNNLIKASKKVDKIKVGRKKKI